MDRDKNRLRECDSVKLVQLAGNGDSVRLVEPSRICHSPREMRV